MNEFIEKLIGRLEELGWVFADYYPDETVIHRKRKKSVAYDDVIEIVNQLAEEYNNGWIPCSERLPERQGAFQTSEYTVTMRKITKVGKSSPFSSHASFDYESKKWLVKGFEVIAWQPLPEPYQPKGE